MSFLSSNEHDIYDYISEYLMCLILKKKKKKKNFSIIVALLDGS